MGVKALLTACKEMDMYIIVIITDSRQEYRIKDQGTILKRHLKLGCWWKQFYALILLLGLGCIQATAAVTPHTDNTGDAQTLTIIEGRIGKRPVYSELVACGITPSEVLYLARSFKKVFDFRNARPDDRYQIYLTNDNNLHKFTYRRDPLDEYVAERSPNGDFHIFKQEILLERKLCAKEFAIETTLYQSVLGGGEKSRLATRYADIFSWDIDFYLYPRKGDRIRILFEKYYHKGRFVKYGHILAAQYLGRRGDFVAYRFGSDGADGYYDDQGRPIRKMFLRTPVKFGTLTSSFSIRRFHPVSKKYKAHTGIDYGAKQGTPIFATASGKVAFAGWKNGYGKVVIIRHPNGYKTYYGHCSRLLVKGGQFVEQGQTIAHVGKTGNATGPHVHYEVRINGKPINPNRVKRSKGKPVDPKYMQAYRELVASYDAQLEEHLTSSRIDIGTSDLALHRKAQESNTVMGR
jgi:murein DD-endopeptidase MepM/ murein hydrolase activator NlpD